MEIKEILCKTALVKSNLPDTDYVINPYSGCELGCVYCYATFISRYLNKDISEWGNFIYPKINILDVLKKQLSSPRLDKSKRIFISSVTDLYTFIDKKYQLTRNILLCLKDYDWQGKIGILTKNPSVINDIDIFSKIHNMEVGMTITSTNNLYSKLLEKKAPLVKQRLNALKTLSDANIKTYAFIGPIIPQYMDCTL